MKGKKRRKEAIERGLPEAPRGCPAVPLTAAPRGRPSVLLLRTGGSPNNNAERALCCSPQSSLESRVWVSSSLPHFHTLSFSELCPIKAAHWILLNTDKHLGWREVAVPPPSPLPPPGEKTPHREVAAEPSPCARRWGPFCRRFSPCLRSTPQTAGAAWPPARRRRSLRLATLLPLGCALLPGPRAPQVSSRGRGLVGLQCAAVPLLRCRMGPQGLILLGVFTFCSVTPSTYSTPFG